MGLADGALPRISLFHVTLRNHKVFGRNGEQADCPRSFPFCGGARGNVQSIEIKKVEALSAAPAPVCPATHRLLQGAAGLRRRRACAARQFPGRADAAA